MTETISRDAAKELIDEVDTGILVVTDLEPVPVIGEIAGVDDLKVEIHTASFLFGGDR